MNDRLIAAFDDCLLALEQGSSLEECLQHYPDLAEELRPQLQMVIQAQAEMSSIQPPPGLQKASRVQFLLQAEKMLSGSPAQADAPENANLPGRGSLLAQTSSQEQTRHLPPGSNGRGTATVHKGQQPARWVGPAPWSGFLTWLLHPLTSKAVGVFAVLAIVILAGVGVLQVSAQSLPGTPFYGIKLIVEDTQLALSPSAESRARLEDKFSEQHYQDARQVTERGWNVSLEFGGILETIDGERWSVGGITVIVPARAAVKGNPAIGLYVSVRGAAQPDRTVLASQVTVEGILFQGRVNQIDSGFWRIDDRNVFIGEDTHIEGSPNPGDLVEVSAMQLSDSNLVAETIRTVSHGEDGQDSGHKGGSQEDGGGNLEPTGLPGGDDHPGRTPEPTHLSGGNDNSGKTPEPGNTPSLQDGSGPMPTETPHGGGSGKPVEPTQSPQPTQAQEPTHTPNTGSKNTNPTSPAPRDVKFQGQVQSINGSTWLIAGQTVQVNASTAVEGSPKVGDNVEVEANVQPDGSLIATRIRVKN